MLPITVAIPTYRRERVLLETLGYLLSSAELPAEIIVLDQTESHEPPTVEALRSLADSGRINWMHLNAPSITAAMNQGLRRAGQEIVLFVDDDVRPDPGLLAAHLAAHSAHKDGLVAGRVIQPWQEGSTGSVEGNLGFAATRPGLIKEFIGCNFSVRRDLAVRLGGFDENFVRVAYRYEAEFAHRYCATGRLIHFEPEACLHHLKDGHGGTRSFGDHLTTWRADHAVGAYYCGLRTGCLREFVARPWRSVATRYHLCRPWRIPVTLWAEVCGMFWAMRLQLRGPQLLDSDSLETGE
jgi:GT2 family glycosyltransferase